MNYVTPLYRGEFFDGGRGEIYFWIEERMNLKNLGKSCYVIYGYTLKIKKKVLLTLIAFVPAATY